MNIKEQFNYVAQEYDANRKKFIPCYNDYYESTTKFIISNMHKPKRVLDLGAGTGLPDGSFDVIISALSIHHLENEEKQKLFTRIYSKLSSGGVFVNYDQFCASSEKMDKWFNHYWEEQLAKSGLTDHDIELWQERRKLDRECSVEEEIEMLRQSQFENTECVYSCQKFSVIVAQKK